MFHEQYEVLLVFSKLSEFNTDLINIIDSERSSCLKFTYLVDPTRKELELLLQQNKLWSENNENYRLCRSVLSVGGG